MQRGRRENITCSMCQKLSDVSRKGWGTKTLPYCSVNDSATSGFSQQMIQALVGEINQQRQILIGNDEF